jgi:hypothetical protein
MRLKKKDKRQKKKDFNSNKFAWKITFDIPRDLKIIISSICPAIFQLQGIL